MEPIGHTDHLTRVLDFGQTARWHPEKLEEVRVPIAAVDVVQQRSRGIRVIGYKGATRRQPIDEPTIDGPKHGVACLGQVTQTWLGLEQPLNLRRAEVRVPHEARAF